MKKMVLIVVGLIVVIGAVLLISRERAQKEITTRSTNSVQAEYTEYTETGEVRREGLTSKGTNYTKVESDKSVQSVGKTPVVISEAVKALLGQDGKRHNYSSLLAAINELDVDNMSAVDVAALMEMLNFPNDRFPEKMRSIEINAVKNDVLDKLLRQKDLPEGLGLQMVEMAGNTENDPVWRDYCIQFMTPFYERAAGERGTTEYTEYTETGDGGERLATKSTKGAESRTSANSVSSSEAGGEQNELSAVHDAMFSALDERSETLAGTALIGLELLSRTHDEFDRETIVEKTVEIASDEQASPLSRLTAMRLSAQISNSEQGILNIEVVQIARTLAQTGETILLRSAAIVTLGETGTAEDRELLESYLASDNRQISAAAEMALQKLEDALRQQNDA